MLFGYPLNKKLFAGSLYTQLMAMDEEVIANTEQSVLPFLVIQCKGDTSNGSLFAASNQCFGGCVTCVKTGESFNEKFARYATIEASQIVTSVFGCATDGIDARMYVSWKDGNWYRVQKLKVFTSKSMININSFARSSGTSLTGGNTLALQALKKLYF